MDGLDTDVRYSGDLVHTRQHVKPAERVDPLEIS